MGRSVPGILKHAVGTLSNNHQQQQSQTGTNDVMVGARNRLILGKSINSKIAEVVAHTNVRVYPERRENHTARLIGPWMHHNVPGLRSCFTTIFACASLLLFQI